MLAGARVLLVEDDFFTAFDLAAEISRAGGQVVGPYASVSACLDALQTEPVEVAVLDANLADRDVTPVALLLIEREIPLVLHTGIGMPPELRRLHPNLPVLMKPADPQSVIVAVALELNKRHL